MQHNLFIPAAYKHVQFAFKLIFLPFLSLNIPFKLWSVFKKRKLNPIAYPLLTDWYQSQDLR